MKIEKFLVSQGLTGFYFDDKMAILRGAKLDGHFYVGNPLTEGHTSVRMQGESESVMLLLDDGEVAYGDCCSGQYSGVGGREPPLFAKHAIPILKKIAPMLEGKEITTFREAADEVEDMIVEGKKLHRGIRYGLTQALLDAVAKKEKRTMAEVLVQEYQTTPADRVIPLFAQTGDDRYIGADKAIIKKVPILPHGLINNMKSLVGKKGEVLLGYVEWLRNRILKWAPKDYRPTIHLDVYGTIGEMFDNNIDKVAKYIMMLEETLKPYPFQVELPIDLGRKDLQMKAMKELKATIRSAGSQVKLVEDEWAVTLEGIKEWADSEAADMIQIKTIDVGGINRIVEAVLYCKKKGVGAYLGGTCNETDRSAQVCANVAIATQPDQMLAKPGMAIDEGLMIVYNEMQRILRLMEFRGGFPKA